MISSGWKSSLAAAGTAAISASKAPTRSYGDDIGFLAELTIGHADGSTQTVVTDTDWTAHTSHVRANSLNLGQAIDARLEGSGPDSATLPVRVVGFDRSTLIDQVGPLITRHEEIKPVRIWTSPAGNTLLDFGQNLVDWIRLRAAPRPGQGADTRRRGTDHLTGRSGCADHPDCVPGRPSLGRRPATRTAVLGSAARHLPAGNRRRTGPVLPSHAPSTGDRKGQALRPRQPARRDPHRSRRRR